MRARLIICDLDNTLYDWVAYFVPSFYAMVDTAVNIIGCDREALLDDLREVHQKHHDSEHPFSLLETREVLTRFNGLPVEAIHRKLDRAFHAFNSTRKRTLQLYPLVRETLNAFRENGIELVAHTEGKLLAVVDRLRWLELTPFFSRIYCLERTLGKHPLNLGMQDWLEDFPIDKVIELSHHQRKPDPSVLLEICARHGNNLGAAAYIGDSMVRDVLMAKAAGVYAIWAEYGSKHDPVLYDKLVRITHWTAEDVARERQLTKATAEIQPDFIAKDVIAEALEPFGLSDALAKLL